MEKEMKMQLNLRPNNCQLAKSSLSRWKSSCYYVDILIYFSLLYNLFIHIILVTCSDPSLLLLSSQANRESSHYEQQQTSAAAINNNNNNKYRTTSQSSNNSNDSTTLPGKDVTNLHLISDFRAVKLRWSYKHNDKNQPASFDVRFCELTSWNIEIKCRHRNMLVEHKLPRPTSTGSQVKSSLSSVQTGEATNGIQQANSVIMAPPIDTVHQLEDPTATLNGPNYEAQIFDLRALTNYTFQVQVARFEHEPPKSSASPINLSNHHQNKHATTTNNRAQSARRLSSGGQEQTLNEHLISRRIETKPFGAEATKCLADVSEVLINTGRYFGGRISVEDSNDPRCHLIGNKTSEQSSYLFKIDHEICASKIVDGKRIETMVLVHENKDILTHNTARFLVLCNFLQKSFTLRASVSLPKVNALLAPSRPAVITSLPRYKLASGSSSNIDSELLLPDSKRATSVMLGSMPGIYRARVPHANAVDIAASATENGRDQATLKRETSTTTKVNPSSSSFEGDEDGNYHEAAAAAAYPSPLSPITMSHKQPAVNNRQPLNELETNTIERKFDDKDSLLLLQQQQQQQRLLAAEGQASHVKAITAAPQTQSQRQSKELGFSSSPTIAIATTQAQIQALQASQKAHSNGIDGSRSMATSGSLEQDQANTGGQVQPTSNKILAQPVRVQSKVLYIEREADASPPRIVRLQQQHHPETEQQQDLYNRLGQHTTTNSVEHSSQIDTPEPRMPTTSALSPSFSSSSPSSTSSSVASPPPPPHLSGYPEASTAAASATDASRHSKQLAKLTGSLDNDEQAAGELQAPIIITNNHRVSGNYLPVAQAAAAAAASSRRSKWLNSAENSNGNEDSQAAGNNFTIKYSADRVYDFPIGNQDDDIPIVAAASERPNRNQPALIMRGRSGRMRSIASDLVLAARQKAQPQVATTLSTTTSAPTVDSLNFKTVDDLMHQPAWSVNRMGETFGGGVGGGISDGSVDLMDSETSNETNSQIMVSNSSSLAQNITGAILRWSLKTLTNLARKSLENLMINNDTSNHSFGEQNQFSTNQATSMQPIELLDNSGSIQRIAWNRDTNTTPEPAIRRSTQPTTASIHLLQSSSSSSPHQQATIPTTTASTRRFGGSPKMRDHESQQIPTGDNNGNKLLASSELRPFEDKLASDGFLISGRQSSEVHQTATTSTRLPLATAASVASHHPVRPGNYSKSLDFGRDLAKSNRNSSERNGSLTHKPPVNQHQANSSGNATSKHHTDSYQHQQQHPHHHHHHQASNESLWAKGAASLYSGWVLYGILLFVALITAISLIICLVSTSPKRRSQSRSSLDSHAEAGVRSIRPLGFKRDSCLPGLVFGGQEGAGCGSGLGEHPSGQSQDTIHHDNSGTYQKYDYNKFENYSTDSIDNNRIGSLLQQQQQQQAINERKTTSMGGIGFGKHSPSEVSHLTRSTSANSAMTMMPEENDCKNNEFLYTEHVLINTGPSFGESYA